MCLSMPATPAGFTDIRTVCAKQPQQLNNNIRFLHQCSMLIILLPTSHLCHLCCILKLKLLPVELCQSSILRIGGCLIFNITLIDKVKWLYFNDWTSITWLLKFRLKAQKEELKRSSILLLLTADMAGGVQRQKDLSIHKLENDKP